MSEATENIEHHSSRAAAAGGMTFDEAEREIASIKQKSKEARQNLEGIKAETRSSFKASSTDSASAPKSGQNIFSHLTSSDAMLDYQIQNARNLVRKQEDLLRLLARMKENLQRSELDIEKCLVSLTPGNARTRLVESSSSPGAAAAAAAGSGSVGLRPAQPLSAGSGYDGLVAGGGGYGYGYGALPESDLDTELAKLRQRISGILDRSEVARRREQSTGGGEALYAPSMSASMGALPTYGSLGGGGDDADPYGYSYSVTYFPDYYSPSRYARQYYSPADGAGGGYVDDWSYSRSLYDAPLPAGGGGGSDALASPYLARRGGNQPAAAK